MSIVLDYEILRQSGNASTKNNNLYKRDYLIKAAKQYNVSYKGNKQAIVDRLLPLIKKASKRAKTSVKKGITFSNRLVKVKKIPSRRMIKQHQKIVESCKTTKKGYMCSPESGRQIKIGGPTYIKLVERGIIIDVRKGIKSIQGSPSKVSPVTSPKSSPRKTSPRKTSPKSSPRKINYFKPNSNLTEQQKKWCRCTLHVAAKQSKDCLSKVKGGKGGSDKCYNPYPVCSARIGTSVRNCSLNYDFSNFPDDELKAYAMLRGIKLPKKYNRKTVLANIATWKKKKEGQRRRSSTTN